MCELFGMSFNMDVRPRFSFKALREHVNQDKNEDGWGLAWYPQGKVQLVKEPIKANVSALSDWLPEHMENNSKVFVGHLRQTSGTAVEYLNTHPFCRKLNEHEYVFAHNGTLRDEYKNRLRQERNVMLGWFRPLGNTDSEYAFCHILRRMDAEHVDIRSAAGFEWLLRKYKDIEQNGDFNCLLTDGEFLFSYRSTNGNSLYFLRRKKPFPINVYLDFSSNVPPETSGRIERAELEFKNEKTEGYIIATKKLTKNEDWIDFSKGELLAFKSGKMVHASSRNARKYFLTGV